MNTPCGCGREAVCEKAGRTVCRKCADELKGREFPLRSGRQSARSSGTWGEHVQLCMLEMRTRRSVS